MLNTMLRLAVAAVLLGACTEHLAYRPMATEPESGYRLSRRQRESLRSGVDPEVLERILARIPPERHAEFLRFFQSGVHAGIVGADAAELNPLLSELWASAQTQRAEESEDSVPPALAAGVTLVLVPRLDEPGTGALILREPGELGDMVVLSQEHASPAQLFRAVGVLMESRLTKHDPAPRTRIAVEATTIPQGVPGAEEAKRIAEQLYGDYLQRLLNAPRGSIRDFGRVRSLRLSSLGEQRSR